MTSFVFSPFVTIGGYTGNMWSAVIAIVPRVCIGIVAYFVYKLIMKAAHGIKGSQTVALWWLVSQELVTNTLFVHRERNLYLLWTELTRLRPTRQWSTSIVILESSWDSVPERSIV